MEGGGGEECQTNSRFEIKVCLSVQCSNSKLRCLSYRSLAAHYCVLFWYKVYPICPGLAPVYRVYSIMHSASCTLCMWPHLHCPCFCRQMFNEGQNSIDCVMKGQKNVLFINKSFFLFVSVLHCSFWRRALGSACESLALPLRRHC